VSQNNGTGRRLIPSALAFVVFLLPFLVRANYPLAAAEYFGLITHVPESEESRVVISAILLGIPYFLSTWFWYAVILKIRPRLTMSLRLERFAKDVNDVVSYKSSEDYYSSLSEYYSSLDNTQVRSKEFLSLLDQSAELLINILLSDLSLAVEGLVQHSSIRISVYLGNLNKDRNARLVEPDMLVKAFTSELSDRFEESLDFPIRRGGNHKNWQPSYCGLAWKNQAPVSGTAYPLPFPFRYLWKDSRFHDGSTSDNSKSFLCIPVVKSLGVRGEPVAVIVIDSHRRYDFILSQKLRSNIDRILYQVKTCGSKKRLTSEHSPWEINEM
jgi:hypothetical protein